VREDWHHAIISFDDSRRSIYMNLRKLYFINHTLACVLLLFACGVLRNLFNLDFSIFRNDILHIELEESVETFDLLRDKTVLLKVGFDYCPSIVSIDRSVWVFVEDFLLVVKVL